MPAKRKKRRVGGARTRKLVLRGRHNGDPVSIQISVRLKRVPKGIKITNKLLEQAVRRKAETSAGYWSPKEQRVIGAREGKDPPGIRLKITSWKNPSRSKRSDRGDRDYGPQADRWGSLWQIIKVTPIRFSRH